MRVLQLISSLGFFGAENVLLEIAKQLQRTALQPIVGVIHNPRNTLPGLAEHAEEYDLEVVRFRCDYRFDMRTLFSLRKYLKEKRIDRLHTHNYKSNFYALISCSRLNIPIITTCHTWFGSSIKMRAFFKLDKSLLNRFDKVVAVSDAISHEISMYGVPSDNIITIPNGIDIQKFSGDSDCNELTQEFDLKAEDKIIGTVGRLTEQKGLTYFISAARLVAKEYPNAVFLIVGDGPLEDSLIRQAEGLRVIFAGRRYNMPAIYSLIDIFVISSLDEGLPMVLLEAMACKTPVVATNVGNIPKVITEKTGILVNSRNERQIAESLIVLLRNGSMADKMGRDARSRIIDMFSSEKMCRDYIKIYRELL